MFVKISKWLAPPIILCASYAVYSAISSGEEAVAKAEPARTKPTVRVTSFSPDRHQVRVSSYGELEPFEATLLSAQVSGEVVSWHPNFVPGGVVKRGEVLFVLESDNYQAAVLEAEAQLARAEAEFIEEKAKAKVAEKQAKQLQEKQVTDLYLRKPQLLSARARVKSAQAALKRAERDLTNCKVSAPYDALVVSRQIGVGQFVTAGMEVAQLNNIESARVHIPIAGFDSIFIPEPLAGTKASVVKKGIENITRTGEIVRDLGVVDRSTRMVSLVVNVDDPYAVNSQQPVLAFGSYVEVSFVGKEFEQVYRIPRALVNGRKVWVVNQEEQLEPREVTVLREEGTFALINKGLSQEDKLVTTLPEYPFKGMRVLIAQNSHSESVAAEQ